MAGRRGVPAPATAAFLKRAIAYLKCLGVRIKRILTDHAKYYTSHAVRSVTGAHGVAHKRTRPCQSQTNSKAEAFNKIPQREWAYIRKYLSNEAPLAALPGFLHRYDQGRPHGGIGGATPALRQ